MKKAVFLDRDGVINEDVDHLNDVKRLRILPGVPEAVKGFNEKGYCVIVVTNQGGIAKDIIPSGMAERIHEEIASRLAEAAGARIDAVYYCPHHPQGVIEQYAVVCECRKPAPGLITRAGEELEIDFAGSFLIGDKPSDILAGKRAGLKSILVKGGKTDLDNAVVPDFFADDLADAVKYIP